jgi:hypothetical protein
MHGPNVGSSNGVLFSPREHVPCDLRSRNIFGLCIIPSHAHATSMNIGQSSDTCHVTIHFVASTLLHDIDVHLSQRFDDQTTIAVPSCATGSRCCRIRRASRVFHMLNSCLDYASTPVLYGILPHHADLRHQRSSRTSQLLLRLGLEEEAFATCPFTTMMFC